jgi:hypothetical protein
LGSGGEGGKKMKLRLEGKKDKLMNAKERPVAGVWSIFFSFVLP